MGKDLSWCGGGDAEEGGGGGDGRLRDGTVMAVAAEAPAEAYAAATLALLDGGDAALPLARREAISATLQPARQAERVMEVYARAMRRRGGGR